MKPRKHVFVCLQKRPPFAKPSCGPRGSDELLQAFATALEAEGLTSEVALTATGCLGPCDSGPTVVVYPDAVWYKGVQPGDAPAIVTEHLRGGTPVGRLLLEWP